MAEDCEAQVATLATQLAVAENRVLELERQNDIVHKKFDRYVTKERFRPAEAVYLGLVGVILIGFISYLVKGALS
jgi:hypothetical protein